MTDRQLLDRFLAARDEAAFAELVRRHAPGVWGACRRRLDRLHDAEDAFQAAFLVLVRRAGRLRPGTPLGPWLGKVAALTARNVARGNRRRAAVTGPLEHDIAAAAVAEPAVDVDAALRALSDADRAAVTLCHLDGLSRKEAAERLGCPEGTLSARLSRAIGKLRVRLADEVPPGLVRSTVRVAVVVGVSSGSAGASPAVAQLAEEAIRMLWVKKLTAAGLALAAAGMVGLGVTRTADAGGQDKGTVPAAKADKPADRAGEGRWFDDAWQQSRTVLDEVRALQEQRDAIQRRLDEMIQVRGAAKADPPPAGAAGRSPGGDEIIEMNRQHLAALAARRRALLDEARSLSEREARLQRVLNEVDLRFLDDRLKPDEPAAKPDKPPAADRVAELEKALRAQVAENEILRRQAAENELLRRQLAEVTNFLGRAPDPRDQAAKPGKPPAAKPDPPPAAKADETPAGATNRHPGADEVMEMNRKHLAALTARRRELLDEARSLSEREARLQRVLNEIELRFLDDRLKKDMPTAKLDPPPAPPMEDPRAVDKVADLTLAILGDVSAEWVARYQLTERTAGKPVFYLTPTPEGLAKLLARAKADPNGPKTVAVEAQEEAKPKDIQPALLALRAAGFKTVTYKGPLEGDLHGAAKGPGAWKYDKAKEYTGPIDLADLPKDSPGKKE
ncbi:MAG: sigma-70 family RNA polymerase sigma factor [Gemmataceae bacterium]|nr:sigma-70 family RNA polymerase sigma factor [Gemmataceae bacterium]